jgi:ABC-2 type transport system permease protein
LNVQRSAPPVPPYRAPGPVNWVGMWTLYSKEVQRFWKVGLQAVVTPVVTTWLFLTIFTVAFGDRRSSLPADLSFAEFLAPGLIMMAVIQRSFANTSSSLLISKIQGNIVDILLPPLHPAELMVGYVLGGVTRGITVGLAVALGMLPFVDMSLHHLWPVLYFGLSAGLLMSMLGLLGGMWATKFDHMGAITDFLITPLAFLSGTFYSIERLPAALRAVSQANPFFYMIDGFRYGMTDHADGSVVAGACLIAGLNIALGAACYRLLRRGWKLKS